MELTRERKVLIAVAALAGAAVLGDRVLLAAPVTGPKQAAAAVTATPAPTVVDAAADKAVSESKPFTGVSLAQRLDEASAQLTGDAPDPFAAHNLWLSESTTSAAAAAAFNPERFAADHPLDAVTTRGDSRHAIVAGRLMNAGDEVGGVVLESIGDRAVVWNANGVRFRVRLRATD